jgi:formate dehydrogenase major subunit
VPGLTIDGLSCDVAEGRTVLAAAAEAGIDIPTACADLRLAPSGSCRLCVVEVDGEPRPVAACTTPVHDGMVVRTHTTELASLRQTLLRLLAADYPPGAVSSAPDEPFHRLLADHGLTGGASSSPDASLVDDSHPLIRVDLNRCIECWRCVRICAEVQGQFSWRIADRGASSRIVPDSGGAFADSSCVSCGACVDTCPTGALEDVNLLGAPRPTRWTRTTCPYCGVGCEMHVGTHAERVVTVVPALDAPVNRGHLCVKGRYAHEFVRAPDRQTRPLIRAKGGPWRPVSWEEAIAAAATGLRAALDTRGPGAVGVLGSARATNEDNYLIQKLARVALGTNNVDCCARVCHAPSATGLKSMLGTGAATSSFADIEAARTILVCGSNTTENHPIVGARIKQAVRRGANLIVIDPRHIELADYAELHLRPRPGTTVALLNAMAAVIVVEGLFDDGFVATRVEGFDAFADHVGAWAPDRVEALCGVPAPDIAAAARLYATAKPAIAFHGLGVTEHTQGTEGVMSLANLALLTGNLGQPGTGVNPLRGQNNVQGAAHMGCEPAHLPGYAPLAESAGRVGAIWGVEIPTEAGLDVMQLLDAADLGTLRALLVAGWDLLLTQPNANVTHRALSRLDTLVIVDLFLNETATEFGTVFLPAASAFEKDGTFMNSERRVQRIRAAVAPPGQAKPDWEIVCRLAAALGRADQFAYEKPADIWAEIRRVWEPGAGIAWERLDVPGGLQWPCPTEDHSGTTLLHSQSFGGTQGPKASLRTIDYRPTPEQPDAEFPLVLITGRNLYAFNAGTMTGRSTILTLRPTDRLEICAADAAPLGIGAGDTVVVRSRYGLATLAADVTERVPPGTVFATFCDPATSLNRLTGPHRDSYTHTPEYKVTAVRLARTDS